MVVGIRGDMHARAGGVLECGGKRERHAALAYVEETSQLEADCGMKSKRRRR
jgi:hypothetical protein